MRRDSLKSASEICVAKAASRRIDPGQDRVTTLRQPCIACIASRLTRPSAWLAKCVAAKVNSTSPLAESQPLQYVAACQNVHADLILIEGS